MFDDDEKTAIMGNSTKCSTLADGTLRIQIDIMPADAQVAFGLFGTPGSAVALARLTNEVAVAHEQPKPTKGPYGEFAKELKLSGFFRSPEVWVVIGSDKQYLEWVKRQPSAVSGDFSEFHDNGEAYCVPAHVRRVEHGSGTGIKPPYSAIPLTNEEHQRSHQQGDNALRPEEWWARMRVNYVSNWAWVTLKGHLGYDSWSDVPPSYLHDWADENGVLKYLPHCYKAIDDGEDQESEAES